MPITAASCTRTFFCADGATAESGGWIGGAARRWSCAIWHREALLLRRQREGSGRLGSGQAARVGDDQSSGNSATEGSPVGGSTALGRGKSDRRLAAREKCWEARCVCMTVRSARRGGSGRAGPCRCAVEWSGGHRGPRNAARSGPHVVWREHPWRLRIMAAAEWPAVFTARGGSRHRERKSGDATNKGQKLPWTRFVYAFVVGRPGAHRMRAPSLPSTSRRKGARPRSHRAEPRRPGRRAVRLPA